MIKKFIWVLVLIVMAACLFVVSAEIKAAGTTTKPVVADIVDSVAEKLVPSEKVKTPNDPVLTKEPALTVAKVPVVEPTKVPKSKKGVTGAKTVFTPVYVLQSGSPTYLANFHYLDAGCAWQGVGGQVFGKDGKPVKGLVIKVTGTWNGNEISQIAVTGLVPNKPYGQGSYEIVLGDVAIKSTTPLYLQVFDVSNNPLSDPVEFYTKAKCSRNLVLINFVKN